MKKYILLIFCAGLLGVYYFFPVPNPGRKLPESLINLNQVFIDKKNDPSVFTGSYWIGDLRNKKALTRDEVKIIELADDAKIQRVNFRYDPPVRFAYYPDYYYFLTDKFYIYSSDDYTESTKVPSIERAVEQLEDKSIYHFCEPADYPHWFLCVRQD